MAAYAASKHGLFGFSHSLSRELHPLGIKVSLLNPGIIDTDFGGATAAVMRTRACSPRNWRH